MKVKIEFFYSALRLDHDDESDRYIFFRVSNEEKGRLVDLRMTLGEYWLLFRPLIIDLIRGGKDREFELTEEELDKLIKDIKENEERFKIFEDKVREVDAYFAFLIEKCIQTRFPVI